MLGLEPNPFLNSGMSHIPPEPIHPKGIHHVTAVTHPRSRHHALAGHHRPATPDALIAVVQREFPNSRIRITGRGRTVHRQAELMAQRCRQNRLQFLQTYRPAQHITEMDNWATAHPAATLKETTTAFTEIINRARRNGAVVSNHLSDRARDISIPHGTPEERHRVRTRLQQLGGHVIDEHDAVGGPHWHVDY